MFCKWCGGNLVSSDTKCNRCGKEIPALSDCGGFYDLVPNAKKPVECDPEPAVLTGGTACQPQPPEPPKEPVPVRGKKRDKKSQLWSTALTAFGFLIVIILLVTALNRMKRFEHEISGLQADLGGITEKIDAILSTTEPAETRPIEETVPEGTDPIETKPDEFTPPTIASEPVLAEQDVFFNITIGDEDYSHMAEVGVILGDYTDTANITYCVDEMAGGIDSIRYALKDANTEVILSISRVKELPTWSISVGYEIDAAVFGQSAASESVNWQYRFDKNAEWQDLPKESMFTQTDSFGKTELSFIEAVLQGMNNHEGQLELRCEIYRPNLDGGSLTIVIEGIRSYEEVNN